jgi:hypothetical protein
MSMTVPFREEIGDGYYGFNLPKVSRDEEVKRLVDQSLDLFKQLSEGKESLSNG